MQPFIDYCRADSSFKSLETEWDGLRKEVGELISTAQKSSKPEDTEAFRTKNDGLTKTAMLMNGRKDLLKMEYDEKVAIEEGMKTSNDLKSGASVSNKIQSLVDVLRSSEDYKSLPDYHDRESGEVIPGMKNWKSAAARKNIAFDLPTKSFNPALALKSLDYLSAMKANEISTSTAPTFYQPMNITVPYALYPSNLLDLLPTFQALNKTVTWRQEATLVRNDAMTAEATAPSQSYFTITLPTATAHMIKGFFKVTEEELMDRPDSLDFISFEAQRDLRIRAAIEILTGNNTGEHLYGVYNQASSNFAKSSVTPDVYGNPVTDVDAIGYGIQYLKVNGVCVPDLGIIHPNQFMPIRLLKNQLGDYIYGPPNAAVTDMYILGVRFIEELYATDGTALVGDFKTYYSLGINQGMTVELMYDGNDATTWTRTLRFSMRCMNIVRRTSAFSGISGLTSQV